MMENPLVWPILELLETRREGWKVHTLASELSALGILSVLDTSAEKDLFKRNFLIMNALYQLRDQIISKDYLQVQAMDIRLISIESDKLQGIANSEPLRDYYTDWSNYEADEEEINSLLDQFWSRYKKHICGASGCILSREEAFALFGLEPDTPIREIKKRWRQLALRWHPDKEEGNAENFRRYCEAWNVLRAE